MKSYNKPEDFTDEDIIALSGVYGVHSFPLKKDDGVIIEKPIRTPHYIQIKLVSKLIKELQVRIYPSEKLILNICFAVHLHRQGFAVNWVRSQVQYASMFSFKTLEGEAYRYDDDKETEWKGYFVWQKYGYLMDEYSVKRFLRMMNELGRDEKDIHSLTSSNEGFNIWMENGFLWRALFDLKEGSLSRTILSQYKPSGRQFI